ncbi:MAG: low molecular weight protein-tyrosine-phosphatase [Acidiferrobacteraceae bacterium]
MKVLFVCLGNICRSPMAEGVFGHLLRQEGLDDRVEIDSAGTHAYHVDEPPDARAQAALSQRGIDISTLRGRKVTPVDIETFDYVLAMDCENLKNLQAICPPGATSKIRLFMEYASNRPEREVPDPYFGGSGGFDQVFDLIEGAASGLLADIRARYHLTT